MIIKTNKSDIIWNYIGTMVSLLTNFVLLPFLMHFLDGGTLGLWYVFLSIGGIVTLFDFGFNPTFARNVAYCWSGATHLVVRGAEQSDSSSKPNMVLLKQVIATCKRIYLIISIIALGLMLTAGTLYVIFISSEIAGHAHILAWCIYAVAVFFNLLYGYYATFLKGVGAVKQYNMAIVFSRVVQIVICIAMLFLEYGIVAAALAYLAYGLIFRLLSKRYFYRYEDIGKTMKNLQRVNCVSEIKDTFSIIWPNAWRDGLVQLSTYLSSQSTTLLCSAFFSLTATGAYSIGVQLVTAIANLSTVMYTAQQPALQSAYIRRDITESRNIMAKSMTIYAGVFLAGVIGVSTIGIPLLSIIKPESVISIPIFLLLSIYVFLYKRHSIYSSFISNTNDIPYMAAFLLSSVISIILAVIMVYVIPVMGIYNLIIAQIIVQLAYNNWKWPMTVHKLLNTSSAQIIKDGYEQLQRYIKSQV